MVGVAEEDSVNHGRTTLKNGQDMPVDVADDRCALLAKILIFQK